MSTPVSARITGCRPARPADTFAGIRRGDIGGRGPFYDARMSASLPELPALPSVFRPSATARVQGAAVIVLVTALIAVDVGSVTLLIVRNGIATDTADAIALVPVVIVAVLGTVFLVGRLSTRWVVDRASGGASPRGLRHGEAALAARGNALLGEVAHPPLRWDGGRDDSAAPHRGGRSARADRHALALRSSRALGVLLGLARCRIAAAVPALRRKLVDAVSCVILRKIPTCRDALPKSPSKSE